VNDQYCTKPNVQMYLTWLLLSLFRSVFGSSFVPYCSSKKTSGPKTRASFLSVRSVLLRFLIAARLRLVPSEQSNYSCSVSHDGFSFLRFRSILPANYSQQQSKAIQKSQAASHPDFYRLIQFFSLPINNMKSSIYRHFLIQQFDMITQKQKYNGLSKA